MISVNLTTISFKIEYINIIEKVGSAYQRMNEGRYYRVGISPF